MPKRRLSEIYILVDQWLRQNSHACEHGYDPREMKNLFRAAQGDAFPDFAENYDELFQIDTGRNYVFYNGEWHLFDHGWKREVATAPAPKTYPTNCKNCGAVLHSHICEYCGSEYHGSGLDEILERNGDDSQWE